MKRLVAAALLLALLAWLYWRRPDPGTVVPNRPGSQASSASAPRASRSSAVSAGERSTLADTLNSPTTDIRADLRVVSEIVDTFRSNFPRDGNPTGTNAEITAALTGKNKLRLALIPPDHPAINARGELSDRWGTQFFFQAESGTRMELRSAGPGKKLFTADDVVFPP